MFNMDLMRQGADAFGKIAESIEAMRAVAYATAMRDGLRCPGDMSPDTVNVYCSRPAGHPGDHVGPPPEIGSE